MDLRRHPYPSRPAGKRPDAGSSAGSRRQGEKRTAMPTIMLLTLHRGFPVDYPRHIDHSKHTVLYLTDRVGLRLVPARHPGSQVAIADPQDVESIYRAATDLVGKSGLPDIVCAPSEYDLATASVLRSRFGLPGLTE